ncbi:MAG: hypothetical protein LBI15_02275 [Dysgonamonadaceae bacterium]|jgi:predicted  nucleic acid-binding Zn-ribbon protein|nr:hypothetical protein [Dysgonamonadaceae bacterium]
MKSIDQYYNEIKKKAIEHWQKEGYVAFKDMENDPVINLLLSALSYQSFRIQKDLEQQEERMLHDFRDRTIPYQLIKPVPAFTIVESAIAQPTDDKVIGEKTIDETCVFALKNTNFVPLLETKIINVKSVNITQQGINIRLEIQTAAPIDSLAGMSLFIDIPQTVSIEAIKCNDVELPIIKPSQYNELPFTKWFNNAHLLLNQNHYLFGTYDYWQEIFLTNTTKLFYIGEYDPKTVPLTGKTLIELDVILSSEVDVSNSIKINCIPVVNVEKKELTLNNEKPVQNLSSETGAFLHLLYDKREEYFDKYMNSFLIRQHGVERYNFNRLLEQMQDILHRYASDYYAFHLVEELKGNNQVKKMQEVIDEISDVAGKFEHTDTKGDYYAILKKNKTNNNRNIHLSYLTTSGAAANGIKKNEKAIGTPDFLDRNKTVLLLDTKGGKDSVKDEAQKENIANYYFQTKDRLVTSADIRAFIRTFYYDESNRLGDEVEDITIKRMNEYISIMMKLKDDSLLKGTDKIYILGEVLQNKIILKSTGIMSFRVEILE